MGYCAKSGLSSSEWDTVKHQQGAVFNIPVCKWSIKDAIFPVASKRYKNNCCNRNRSTIYDVH
jgi:hypothetical protein